MQVWVFNSPDEKATDFIYSSLLKGFSRFGWSYIDTADLNILERKRWEELNDDETECYRKTSFLLNIEIGDWIVHVNIPEWGKCTAAQVISTYEFDKEHNSIGIDYTNFGDYRHLIKIDVNTLITFDRNNHNVLPYVSRRLKLQGHYWTIKKTDDFLQSINNLKSNAVNLEGNITHGLYHLRNDIRKSLKDNSRMIQENHPGKQLEEFIALIFERVPNVVDVKRNGSGWGTDYGADLIITYNTGIPILDFQTSEIIVVQVKSFTGLHDDINTIEQIATAIDKYNAKSGIIFTTAVVTDSFIAKVNDKSKSIGKAIGIISGDDVASFVLKYGSDLLFDI